MDYSMKLIKQLNIDKINFNNPVETRTLLEFLLCMVEKLYSEKTQLQREVQKLKDYINTLKGEKGRPDIKSNTNKEDLKPVAAKSKMEQHPRKKWTKSSKLDKIKIDAKIFLNFLKNVLEIYPTGKIAMILDNSKIHHAKLIQPFLEEHKYRLELVFLAPYSPNLNLIEGLWGWLKSDIINNVFYTDARKIKIAVRKFIRSINQNLPTIIDRLCVQL
ncbi:Transposase [Anaerovirgula multivorans]|uniref:Transposase n=1 Tax=Anaerovirgula multivorans TaxID=312168 RepID=A0A239KYI6_9FIRM|nr:Transposase [Anaerovirgula multivorans]